MKKYFNYKIGIICSILFCASCGKNSDSVVQSSPGTVGVGGSLARFAVVENHLYLVNPSVLKLYDITNPANPTYVKTSSYIPNAETIFVRDNNTLFIGSQDGMYIYDISIPGTLAKVSLYTHIRSCDPVVADDNYAYVTLRVDNACNAGVNVLEVVDISNIAFPYLQQSYSMFNPKGLGIDGDKLYVCDDGLKLMDKSDVNDIKLIKAFDIPANDVIAYNDTVLVIVSDGLYQYAYNGTNLNLLSKIAIKE